MTPETQKVEPINYVTTKLPIDEKIFNIIHDGMYDVVNTPGGTATNIQIPELKICGKTGTAPKSSRQRPLLVYMFCSKRQSKNSSCLYG